MCGGQTGDPKFVHTRITSDCDAKVVAILVSNVLHLRHIATSCTHPNILSGMYFPCFLLFAFYIRLALRKTLDF